ncbi:kinase-like domain-containing protein [Daedaleopsis nitida]|nr:kinase-like domain-containing protein [Daedaleopsis nitida]
MTEIAASLPDLTGATVDKRYKLLKILGSGACGVVYKALDIAESYDADAPHYLAIKLIPKRGRTPEQIATVRREVEFHSALSAHPNVVTLHDAYDDGEWFYMIMDYLPGGDLFGQICEAKAYAGNDELVRAAFLSLIDAVQACHEHQIAHRDLKPENVLTSADGSQVFLADFGLASNKRMCEDAVGTYIYMAPECYISKPYCPRSSDVWALGVVLFNMITAINPWQQASLKDRCYKRFLVDPDHLYDAFPISAGAHKIVLRALAFTPLRRPTLPELREMVLSLDTFFRPTEGKPAPAPAAAAEAKTNVNAEGKCSVEKAKLASCDSRSSSTDSSLGDFYRTHPEVNC